MGFLMIAGGWASWRDEEEATVQEAARVRSPGSLREAEQMIASCLIRLIHLLSLYREVYLTPKQTILI